jgi:hypothetical protein
MKNISGDMLSGRERVRPSRVTSTFKALGGDDQQGGADIAHEETKTLARAING